LERTNPTAQLRLIFLIYGLPRNGESDVRTRLSEDGEGFDQRDEVLLNVEIADGEDERGGRARLFRRREVGIDAVMDDRRAAFGQEAPHRGLGDIGGDGDRFADPRE